MRVSAGSAPSDIERPAQVTVTVTTPSFRQKIANQLHYNSHDLLPEWQPEERTIMNLSKLLKYLEKLLISDRKSTASLRNPMQLMIPSWQHVIPQSKVT